GTRAAGAPSGHGQHPHGGGAAGGGEGTPRHRDPGAQGGGGHMSEGKRIVDRGLYFEEFEEGAVYVHAPSRTVTEADNLLFSTMTMNPQSLHLDAQWSKGTEFGERLVNSMFTLALLVGLSVAQLTQ